MGDRRKRITGGPLKKGIEAAAVMAITSAPFAPATGLLKSGIAGVIEALKTQFQERSEERFDNLMAGISKETGLPLDEIGILITQNLDFEEAVLRAVRLALEAHHAVLPAIARLVASYRERPVDVFFRGAARLLQELDAQSLNDLRAILAAFVKVAGVGGGGILATEFHLDEGGLRVRQWSKGEKGGEPKLLEGQTPIDPVQSAATLLRLLRLNGLGYDSPLWRVGGGLEVLRIKPDDGARLLALITLE